MKQIQKTTTDIKQAFEYGYFYGDGSYVALSNNVEGAQHALKKKRDDNPELFGHLRVVAKTTTVTTKVDMSIIEDSVGSMAAVEW